MTNKIVKTQIGQRIRSARKNANLTLAEVSKRVGISNQALSAIERGKKNPSKQTLMSLARVFGDNFGEVWLADYLSEHQAEFHLVAAPQGPNIDKVSLMQLFEEFLDSKYGEGQVKIVPEHKENAVPITVGFEILETGIEVIDDSDEHIQVPPQMILPDKGAMAGIVRCKSLRDAFVDEGDYVIITERPSSVDGTTILAITNNVTMLKRCEIKREKVILRSFDEHSRPLRVNVNELICVGEVIGVIRLIERHV